MDAHKLWMLRDFIGTNKVLTILFTYKQIQRDSYLRRENEKWFDVESVFSNALNTINLMPPLIETMEINGIEPKEAIKQIQRYQVNANICLDQILTSLDSADYRKVRTLSNSMERAREKFFQVMQNRAEIYEKLFRVNEKENAERIMIFILQCLMRQKKNIYGIALKAI